MAELDLPHSCIPSGLSLVVMSRGYSLVAVHRFLLVVASLVAEHGLWALRLQQLWRLGLAALQHVGSSQTRDQTHVCCISRWILNR